MIIRMLYIIIHTPIYHIYNFQQLHVYFPGERVHYVPHTAIPEVSKVELYKARKVTATSNPTAP